jgi:integrase
MKAENLNVLFYLNKTKINQKGHCTIYCRITFKKERKQFSTGNSIFLDDWNSKKQLAESNEIDYKSLNGKLSLLKQEINNIHFKLEIERKKVTLTEIIETLFYREEKIENSIVSYLKNDLSKLEKLIDKDIKLTTWKKFSYAYNDVAAFIKFKFNKRDLPLKDLDLNFLIDFEYYLKTEKNNKQITVNKTIQRFRKPIKNAIFEGYLDKDPFFMYKTNRVKKEVIFLTTKELKKLEKHVFKQDRLQIVADLFIFCCYTGLAYNEMDSLKSENIIVGFDKMEWINIKREKTNKLISVPILPKAKSILNKYSDGNELLPSISNQKFNSYLKEIADIIEINKRITHHIARKTFASTILLYNNVPMEIVSELLGHSNILITQESYGKVVQTKVSEQMKKLSRKLK